MLVCILELLIILNDNSLPILAFRNVYKSYSYCLSLLMTFNFRVVYGKVIYDDNF